MMTMKRAIMKIPIETVFVVAVLIVRESSRMQMNVAKTRARNAYKPHTLL